MNKNKHRSFLGFGFSTILLSFVMICVITFAVLSAVTSYADYKLSRQVADKTAAYYKAQARACETLDEIDAVLLESYEAAKTTDSSAYYTLLAQRLTPYGTLTATDTAYTLSFAEPVTDKQQLCIKLLLNYPQTDDEPFYNILEWKSVYEQASPEELPMQLIQ